MQRVDLEIGVRTDVDGVGDKLESVGTSAKRMADDVDAASRQADSATSRLDHVAESADGMASSSSQAAGGLGDLGGALALMPGPLGAVGAGMEAAAPAIMGVTGAADLANLAFKGQRISTIRATVASKAHTVTTKAATIAQRALNLAMRANPLGILITGLLLVAGLFVLAYKKSETFRRVVDGVVSKVKAALGAVVDVLGNIVDWVRDKVPDAWQALRSKVSAVIDAVKGFVTGLRDKIVDAGAAVRDKLGGAFDWVMDKIQPIIDAVQRVIDLIGKIDFPDIPFLGRASSTGVSTTSTAGAGFGVVDARDFSVNVTVEAGADLSPAAVRAIMRAVVEQQTRAGSTPVRLAVA